MTYDDSGYAPAFNYFLNKIDAYDTNKVENIKSYGYGKVFFNYENIPFLALSYSKQTACYLNNNNFDSLYCFERNSSQFGSISYKNNIVLFNNETYQNEDSILRFSTHNIIDKKDIKNYNFKMPRKLFTFVKIDFSYNNNYFIVSSFKNYKPMIDIFTTEGNLVFTIDDVIQTNIGWSIYDINSIFHFLENEKYLVYFTKNGLIKFNLQTFEKKELLYKQYSGINYSVISPNEKFILVSLNDSLTYIDLTNMEMTLLSTEKFENVKISNSNEYFYGIKRNESEFLYKYRIKTPTSINEEEKETNLSISPNPSSDFINIVGVEPETSLELTNILGETVWSGIGVKQISTQAMPNGTYFLKTTKGNQIKSQKVLVWR